VTAGFARNQAGKIPARAVLTLPLLAICALTFPMGAYCADIYASRGEDGELRYASQPIDPSYQLIFSDEIAKRVVLKPRVSQGANMLGPLIERVAAEHGIAAELIYAIVEVESGYNTAAVSPKGARGPMQLMLATATRYGLRQATDLHNPEKNIQAGVRHLKDLLQQHDGNVALALAAYNAGAGAVQRHGSRIPPFRETMLYVPAVLSRSAAAAAR